MTTPLPAPEALVERLRSGSSFLITSHLNPDGDAVGSSLGLARALRALGKTAIVWHHDATPTLYRPLPGSDRIRVGSEPPASFPDGFDAVIVLECPGPDRTGLESEIARLPILNIDHHLGNQQYGELNWVDSSAPAVGEMVLHLARELRSQIDADTATALYLALVTDTGGFRFANATPRAFEAAAELVRLGARPELVSQWLHESRSEGSVRLQGELLANLEIAGGGRVATAVLTSDMFERAGATTQDTEGLIDVPRSIAGVDAVALIRQVDGGSFKVSLRSRGATNVERIARAHGGGGHHNAAGYLAEGALDEVRRQAVEQLEGALE